MNSTAATEAHSASGIAKVVCPYCRQNNPAIASKCVWCGSPLSTSNPLVTGPLSEPQFQLQPQPQYQPQYTQSVGEADQQDRVNTPQISLWHRKPGQLIALLILIGAVVSLAFLGVRMLTPATPAIATQFTTPLGVSATLPGKGWSATEDLSTTGNKLYESYILSSDMVVRVGQVTSGGSAQEESDYSEQHFFVPPVTRTQVSFHDYPATLLDGKVYQDNSPTANHAVAYIFPYRGDVMSVIFMSPEATWETTGKPTADAIMQSVTFK